MTRPRGVQKPSHGWDPIKREDYDVIVSDYVSPSGLWRHLHQLAYDIIGVNLFPCKIIRFTRKETAQNIPTLPYYSSIFGIQGGGESNNTPRCPCYKNRV